MAPAIRRPEGPGIIPDLFLGLMVFSCGSLSCLRQLADDTGRWFLVSLRKLGRSQPFPWLCGSGRLAARRSQRRATHVGPVMPKRWHFSAQEMVWGSGLTNGVVLSEHTCWGGIPVACRWHVGARSSRPFGNIGCSWSRWLALNRGDSCADRWARFVDSRAQARQLSWGLGLFSFGRHGEITCCWNRPRKIRRNDCTHVDLQDVATGSEERKRYRYIKSNQI